jgi:excisionase family DNA binding protein
MVSQKHELLTSAEVAARLLEEPTLRRRVATCVLPAVRVSSEWRFRRSDLEAWIRQQARHVPSGSSTAA